MLILGFKELTGCKVIFNGMKVIWKYLPCQPLHVFVKTLLGQLPLTHYQKTDNH